MLFLHIFTEGNAKNRKVWWSSKTTLELFWSGKIGIREPKLLSGYFPKIIDFSQTFGQFLWSLYNSHNAISYFLGRPSFVNRDKIWTYM